MDKAPSPRPENFQSVALRWQNLQCVPRTIETPIAIRFYSCLLVHILSLRTSQSSIDPTVDVKGHLHSDSQRGLPVHEANSHRNCTPRLSSCPLAVITSAKVSFTLSRHLRCASNWSYSYVTLDKYLGTITTDVVSRKKTESSLTSPSLAAGVFHYPDCHPAH